MKNEYDGHDAYDNVNGIFFITHRRVASRGVSCDSEENLAFPPVLRPSHPLEFPSDVFIKWNREVDLINKYTFLIRSNVFGNLTL